MAFDLQTGCTGSPVTSASDALLYSNIFGKGCYVLDHGDGFAATMADANTLLVGTGEAMMYGRNVLGEGPTRFVIPSGMQGKKRAHIAVIRYTKDRDGAERTDAVVVSGEPVDTGTPGDPEWHRESILDGATISDMPLYRVVTDGINAGDPVRLFETHAGSMHAMDVDNVTDGVLSKEHGGTGMASSPSLLVNLASTAAAGVLQASPRPGVTGVLPEANGGTGVKSSAAIGLKAYPVNAVYLSRASANPAALFGGTWAEITDSKLFLGIYMYRRTA